MCIQPATLVGSIQRKRGRGCSRSRDGDGDDNGLRDEACSMDGPSADAVFDNWRNSVLDMALLVLPTRPTSTKVSKLRDKEGRCRERARTRACCACVRACAR